MNKFLILILLVLCLSHYNRYFISDFKNKDVFTYYKNNINLKHIDSFKTYLNHDFKQFKLVLDKKNKYKIKYLQNNKEIEDLQKLLRSDENTNKIKSNEAEKSVNSKKFNFYKLKLNQMTGMYKNSAYTYTERYLNFQEYKSMVYLRNVNELYDLSLLLARLILDSVNYLDSKKYNEAEDYAENEDFGKLTVAGVMSGNNTNSKIDQYVYTKLKSKNQYDELRFKNITKASMTPESDSKIKHSNKKVSTTKSNYKSKLETNYDLDTNYIPNLSTKQEIINFFNNLVPVINKSNISTSKTIKEFVKTYKIANLSKLNKLNKTTEMNIEIISNADMSIENVTTLLKKALQKVKKTRQLILAYENESTPHHENLFFVELKETYLHYIKTIYTLIADCYTIKETSTEESLSLSTMNYSNTRTTTNNLYEESLTQINQSALPISTKTKNLISQKNQEYQKHYNSKSNPNSKKINPITYRTGNLNLYMSFVCHYTVKHAVSKYYPQCYSRQLQPSSKVLNMLTVQSNYPNMLLFNYSKNTRNTRNEVSLQNAYYIYLVYAVISNILSFNFINLELMFSIASLGFTQIITNFLPFGIGSYEDEDENENEDYYSKINSKQSTSGVNNYLNNKDYNNLVYKAIIDTSRDLVPFVSQEMITYYRYTWLNAVKYFFKTQLIDLFGQYVNNAGTALCITVTIATYLYVTYYFDLTILIEQQKQKHSINYSLDFANKLYFWLKSISGVGFNFAFKLKVSERLDFNFQYLLYCALIMVGRLLFELCSHFLDLAAVRFHWDQTWLPYLFVLMEVFVVYLLGEINNADKDTNILQCFYYVWMYSNNIDTADITMEQQLEVYLNSSSEEATFKNVNVSNSVNVNNRLAYLILNLLNNTNWKIVQASIMKSMFNLAKLKYFNVFANENLALKIRIAKSILFLVILIIATSRYLDKKIGLEQDENENENEKKDKDDKEVKNTNNMDAAEKTYQKAVGYTEGEGKTEAVVDHSLNAQKNIKSYVLNDYEYKYNDYRNLNQKQKDKNYEKNKLSVNNVNQLNTNHNQNQNQVRIENDNANFNNSE